MKPPRFVYHDPTSRAEALTLLATYTDDAKILAGGQSLMPILNMRLAQPAHVIDINRIADLAYIQEANGGLAIGALTRHASVECSFLVRQRCPLLAEAITYVGHTPIRSRGTIGGSLAHADPAAELPAVLLALGGHVRVEAQSNSHTSSRIVSAAELFVSELQTVLASNELLTEVWFPIAPPRTGSAFIEISRRHGDYALVGVAAQLSFNEQGTIIQAHLALLGVGATPLHASTTEALLLNEQPGEQLFHAAAEQASEHLEPQTDMHASAEYRRSVAAVLVERALHLCVKRAMQKDM